LLLIETEELKHQLKVKEQEVKRAERLATLGETAAAIAHEVRNPLGAITLFVSLLRRDVAEMPSTLSLVDQIEASVGSINHVVENILQFSRGKPLLFAPLNLNLIIEEQVLSLRSKLSDEGAIDIKLDATPLCVGNEVAIKQIVHNLVLNGIQATKGKGTITVTTSDSGSEAIEIRVQDTGSGVPAELRSKIFEPFITSKNEGTGLGLAIVHRLVAQHGGTIELLDNELTTFQIVFPRSGRNQILHGGLHEA
jgi:two-component system sensor histidine kinase AtoS